MSQSEVIAIGPRDIQPASLNQPFIQLIEATRLHVWIPVAFATFLFTAFLLPSLSLLGVKHQSVKGILNAFNDPWVGYAFVLSGMLLALWSARGEALHLREILVGRLSYSTAIGVGVLIPLLIASPYVLFTLVTIVLQRTLPLIAEPPVLGTSMVGIIFMSVLGPIVEEVFYRVWIQSVLQRHWGIWGAIVTGALFDAEHVATWLWVLPLAITVTWIRYKYGSLLATVVAHMTNNGFLVLLFFLAGTRL
ncbi:MAG: CPBP family intramembrane glutamic endopeptidase [Vulcanimicrobiaceae bacterium]